MHHTLVFLSLLLMSQEQRQKWSHFPDISLINVKVNLLPFSSLSPFCFGFFSFSFSGFFSGVFVLARTSWHEGWKWTELATSVQLHTQCQLHLPRKTSTHRKRVYVWKNYINFLQIIQNIMHQIKKFNSFEMKTEYSWW